MFVLFLEIALLYKKRVPSIKLLDLTIQQCPTMIAILGIPCEIHIANYFFISVS